MNQESPVTIFDLTGECQGVIRIWEYDATPLLSQPELLPLAVLAKSEQPQILLSQVAEGISKIEDQRKKSNITACVELLAGINYSRRNGRGYKRRGKIRGDRTCASFDLKTFS